MTRLSLLFCLALACVHFPRVRAIPTHTTEPGPTTQTPLPRPRWQTYAPPGGRFSVLLPAAPVALAGSKFHTYTCNVNDVLYAVQYRDLPPKDVQLLGADELLTILGGVFLKTSHSRIISKSRLTRNGFPGVKIVALRPSGRQQTFCVYVAGTRSYNLTTTCPAGDTAAASDADKFLNSFTPTPAAPPKPAR